MKGLARVLGAANYLLPPAWRRYLLHVDELMRFHRYVLIHLHIYPALPAHAIATLMLPDGAIVPLPIIDRGDHSRLIHEFLTETAGQPVHEATLTVSIGDSVVSFPQIGSLGAAPDPWHALNDEFRDHCRALRNCRVLEIGSRIRDDTRSVLHEEALSDPSIDYTGFDILPGSNVDVVGDAHRLSSYFAPDSFDLVCSEFVFEHLLMPWRVVTEINEVLKLGGEVMINTNHTMALHDKPWDFWRFSDTAWIGLLNEFTGFQILKSALGVPMRLTPVRYNDSFREHEGGAGFQACGVWARKIGPARVGWPADSEVLLGRLARAYPEQIKD
jgi:hypothetical protein